MVEIAALIQWRRLLLRQGARGNLVGLPSAGSLRLPSSAPTSFLARRLGRAGSWGLFRGRLVKQAFGFRIRVRTHLLRAPGFARKKIVSHWHRAQAGGSAGSARLSPGWVWAQWAMARTAAVFLPLPWGVGEWAESVGRGPLQDPLGLSDEALLFLAPPSARSLLQRLALPLRPLGSSGSGVFAQFLSPWQPDWHEWEDARIASWDPAALKRDLAFQKLKCREQSTQRGRVSQGFISPLRRHVSCEVFIYIF